MSLWRRTRCGRTGTGPLGSNSTVVLCVLGALGFSFSAVSTTAGRFQTEMEAAWAFVDQHLLFRIRVRESRAPVLSHAILSSTHPFVTGTTLIAAMAPLMNGANIKCFQALPHSSISSSSWWIILKFGMCQMTKNCSRTLEIAWTPRTCQRQRTVQLHVRNLKRFLASAELTSFTLEKFIERCSGDAQQQLGVPSLRGSVHLGWLANTGEVYAPFLAFGLISEEKQRSNANSVVANQHVGTLNRLLQWNECARQTTILGVMVVASHHPCHPLGVAIP